MSVSPATPAPPGLRRVLRLRDLVLYGIIVIQPVAPMSVFGVLHERGQGHVVTAVLLAMVAMLLTGLSYGRMAGVHPDAGSAFAYVSREIHPAAGWFTGWGMLMDYVLNPLICTIWCAQQAHTFFPAVPVWLWKVVFGLGFTLLNLRGIQASARTNALLALGLGTVVVAVLWALAAHVAGAGPHPPGFFTRPFYDPATFSPGAVLGCTSVAVLTYIGFDGISTLSEEVENPRRNILLATVCTCLVLGVLAALQVYLAQLAWPAGRPFANVDTAYVAVAGLAHPAFFGVLGAALLVANVGSGAGAHLGAARLLYGMGRNGALPPRFFAAVDPRSGVPRRNVLLVGAAVLGGSQVLSFGLGAELLNFGALVAFMGVNAACFARFFLRAPRRSLAAGLPPLLGFGVCLGLWLNLSAPALLWGALWAAAGLALGATRTRGFRPVPA